MAPFSNVITINYYRESEEPFIFPFFLFRFILSPPPAFLCQLLLVQFAEWSIMCDPFDAPNEVQSFLAAAIIFPLWFQLKG